MEIRDQRKYVKTSFVSEDRKTVLVIRLNQSTKKDYSVLISYDTWIDFRKERQISLLQIAGFDSEQIDFLSANKLKGERKVWPKKIKQHKFKTQQYRI